MAQRHILIDKKEKKSVKKVTKILFMAAMLMGMTGLVSSDAHAGFFSSLKKKASSAKNYMVKHANEAKAIVKKHAERLGEKVGNCGLNKLASGLAGGGISAKGLAGHMAGCVKSIANDEVKDGHEKIINFVEKQLEKHKSKSDEHGSNDMMERF
jgi:hypothetical protein